MHPSYSFLLHFRFPSIPQWPDPVPVQELRMNPQNDCIFFSSKFCEMTLNWMPKNVFKAPPDFNKNYLKSENLKLFKIKNVSCKLQTVCIFQLQGVSEIIEREETPILTLVTSRECIFSRKLKNWNWVFPTMSSYSYKWVFGRNNFVFPASWKKHSQEFYR